MSGARQKRQGWIREDGVGCIPLTKGHVALVDAADLEWLTQRNWHLSSHVDIHYAHKRVCRPDGTTFIQAMHREIVGGDPPRVDHIDGDGLNNQRHNLRPCTHRQNAANRRGAQANNTTGYLGVWIDKRRGRFCINVGGKSGKRLRKQMPAGATAEDAARDRDGMATSLYGEFARLNFPAVA